MTKPIVWMMLLMAVVASAFAAMFFGSATISVAQGWSLIIGESTSPLVDTIIFQIRLPRVLLALIVGAGTAATGAAIQGMFRNPLADPALIGVSSGAALFAAAYMVLNLHNSAWGFLGLAGSAFTGGFITTLLVLKVGQRSGTISSMLLAGIAVNAIALAGVGLFSYLSSDLQLRSVAFWALGSFNGADWVGVQVALVIPMVVLLLYRDSQKLNAVTLGDLEATHLGINVPRLRTRIVLYTAVITGTSVALVGIIAFIGLVVPHLIRLMLGSNHHTVIPGSALLGALLLLMADTLGRVIIAPAELPVGILTALLGGPFFIYLVVQQKGRLGI
jgi:iron complex transport system permease protein